MSFVCSKHTKINQTLKTLIEPSPKQSQFTMKISNFTASSQHPPLPPPQQKAKGRGNKIMVGMVFKENIEELGEEVIGGLPRRMKKELTGLI